MRIRWQFLIVILSVGLLPLLGIGYVSYRVSRDRLEHEAEENLKTLNRLVAGELDQYINTMKERIRARSVQRDTTQFFEPDRRREYQEPIQSVLDRFRNIDPVNIVSVALFLASGEKMGDTNASTQALDESKKDWVRKPIETGAPVSIAEATDDSGASIWIGTPVRNASNEIVGVVRVKFQLSALQQIVSRLSPDKSSFAILVDKNNLILAHGKSPELIGEKDSHGLVAGGKVATFLQVRLQNRPGDAESCYVSVASLEHEPWTVAVFQVPESFDRGKVELQRFMWLSGLTALLMLGVAAVLTSKLLSRPIARLAETAKAIDDEHIQLTFPEAGPEEVRELAKAFNAMTQRLALSRTLLQAKIAETEEKEARLRDIISLSPIAIAVADDCGNILQLNRAFVALFGYDMDQISTMDAWWSAVLPNPESRSPFVREMRARGAAGPSTAPAHAGVEQDVLAKDGTTRSIDFRAKKIGPTVITVCLDLTDRRSAELEVQRLNVELEHRVAARTMQLASANAELESFSYAVSHDLRSPLRAMDGFSRALEEDYASKLDEEGIGYLRRIRAASQRMGVLIDDLLKLARVSRTEIKRESIDLSIIANGIVQRLRNEDPNRKVVFTCAPHLPVSGDRSLIQIAMENLVENAWKYTRKKPEAQVTFGCKSDVQNDGTLDITYFIKDNGAGFDMRYAGKLFGAFQRLHSATEFEGTGVGLATVRRVINRHGGRIWAQAAPDQGAAFYFTLPRSESGSPFPPARHTASPFSPQSVT